MKILNIISLFICGLSVGWLIGLSVSPVIQTVIGSILATITSAITILSSFQNGDLKEKVTDKFGEINMLPLALFLLGLSIASTLGIYARTNDWFGINPISFKNKWDIKEKDTTGIIETLYNSRYGQDSKESSDKNQGVLLGNSANCNELLKINDEATLISQLQQLGPEWQKLADSVQENVSTQNRMTVLRQKITNGCK